MIYRLLQIFVIQMVYIWNPRYLWVNLSDQLHHPESTHHEADAWGTRHLLHVPLVRLSIKIYIPGEHLVKMNLWTFEPKPLNRNSIILFILTKNYVRSKLNLVATQQLHNLLTLRSICVLDDVLDRPYLEPCRDTLLQLKHDGPVELVLDHILETYLFPHPLVQPSVIIKVNNMINSRVVW